MAKRSKWIVTRVELARLTGLTPDQVSKRIQEGLPGVVRTGAGRGNPTEIDLEKALPWFVSNAASLREDFLRWQIRKVEQEVRMREHELVEASEVESRWATIAVSVRERLLSLPAMAVQRKLVDEAAEDGLIALVDEALRELATGEQSNERSTRKVQRKRAKTGKR